MSNPIITAAVELDSGDMLRLQTGESEGKVFIEVMDENGESLSYSCDAEALLLALMAVAPELA